jgi:DNA modification methylase
MRTYITLRNQDREPLPDGFTGPDVRYTKALVRAFLEEYTRVGDAVLDPFAGFGTTLIVAEEMGREAWGLELDSARAEYARSQIRHPERLITGDSRQLVEYPIPPFDFSITSPPYMGKSDAENPFTGYAEPGQYTNYLAEVGEIYAQMGRLMKLGAKAVVEASNLKGGDSITTLAWDIAREVGKTLIFEGEIIATWEDGYGYGYDHSYCLVFAKKGTA